MSEISIQSIVSALQNLTFEELDRVRLRLWERFGEQLRKIPDAPDPDDLLHETVEDLLADRRHCPLHKVKLTVCLFNIVRSKVSHLYKKSKAKGIIHVSDAILNGIQLPKVQAPELYDTILALVEDDALLTHIVEYQLGHLTHSHKPLKAQALAEAFGMDIHDIYNANRRLKARLEKLVTTSIPDRAEGGAYVATSEDSS